VTVIRNALLVSRGEEYIIGVFVRSSLLILFAALQSIAVPRLSGFAWRLSLNFDRHLLVRLQSFTVSGLVSLALR